MSKTGNNKAGTGPSGRPNAKNIIIMSLVGFVIVATFFARSGTGAPKTISISQAVKNAQTGKYVKVEVNNNQYAKQHTARTTGRLIGDLNLF